MATEGELDLLQELEAAFCDEVSAAGAATARQYACPRPITL